jgi:RimJ/RimL family protein N-acetyltransferase
MTKVIRFEETSRLQLRELNFTDEEELVDLDSDPEVMKYLTNGIPSSRESVQRSLNRIVAQLRNSNGKFGVWAAIEKETRQFVGWFHLFPHIDEPENLKKLFIGYRLKRKYWGRGFATEVSRALVEKAFGEYGATEVCAQAMKANAKSIKVMEKIGMTFSHEFKEHSFPVGYQDAVMFVTINK